MTLKKLHEDRAACLAEMRAITERKPELTKDDFAQFDLAEKRFNQINTEIRLHEAREAIELGQVINESREIFRTDPLEKAAGFAKGARARAAFDKAAMQLLSGRVSKLDDALINELGGQDFREQRTTYPDGNIIQSSVAADVYLEALTDGNFLERFNRIPVTSGYLVQPKVERGNFPVGETKAAANALAGTGLTFTSDSYTPKNIYVLARYHKDLVRDSDSAAGFFWRAIRAGLQKKLHQICLYGSTGVDGEFAGFDNITGKQTVAGGGAVLSDYSLIVSGAKKLMDVYTPLNNMLAVMNPVLWAQLTNLAETTGKYIDAPGRLAGVEMMTNPEVLTNYSTDKTRIYMFDPAAVNLALFGTFEITLDQRYAEYDHAAAMAVFRADLKMPDVEKLCIIEPIATA